MPETTPTPADLAAAALARVTAELVAGEARPEQVSMCRAVAHAVATGRHLVVQAGTGTGKSLAYSVPAAMSGKKVVVATATKALQDQLADKDLPLVAAALPGFTYAVLKGRSNYLCLQRADEVGGRGHQQRLDVAPTDATDDPAAVDEPSGHDPGEADAVDGDRLVDQIRRMLRWAEETETGDRSDLPFEPHPRAWAAVSVGPRECPGAFRCPAGHRCFTERARARAAEADVVVVNTHLYGAHLASGGAVLPDHDVVVFDEAHEVEAVMTESLGADVTPGRFRALQTLARPVLGPDDREAAPELADVAARLHDALAGRLGTRVLTDPGPGQPRGEGRERALDGPAPAPPDDDVELSRLLELAAGRVGQLTAALRRAERTTDGGDRLTRSLNAAGHLAGDLDHLAARTVDEVAWVDGDRRSPVLRLSPIDVGPRLAEGLWGSVTAVLTSATVPLRLTARLGLEGFALDQLTVGSPFDYRSHSLLYVARHLPDRRRPEAEPALHDELEALITAAGGRTLALFTSRRATTAAVAALRDRLPFDLLEQGQLPKARLLERFSTEESSCLFATMGFWQGVDVPGRSLSLVTVDRLPFARPDDPVLEARRERAGDAAFRLVDIPRAATLLAQGTGRLIRSADDCGVVAVLDPRLATAGYRGALLAALPPMRRTTDRRQVEEFLRRILEGPR